MRGTGPPAATNTITRAELVALLQFLDDTVDSTRWNKVATDSLAGMYLIQKAIMHPHSLTDHPHQELLSAIRARLRARYHPVHIYKVKSHSGIIGNEMADIGAVLAGASNCDHVTVGLEGDRQGYWPVATATQTNRDGRTTSTRIVPGSLTTDVKKICHGKLKLGYADTKGTYFTAWHRILPKLDRAISNAFLTARKP